MKLLKIPWFLANRPGKLSTYFLLWLAATSVSCDKCDVLPKRPEGKTEIVGRVTDDQTKLPIEGVEILLKGSKGFLQPARHMKSYFTNQNGEYEIILETVPDSIKSLNIVLLFTDNPIFYPKYSNSRFFGGDGRNCCPAAIGQRTEYDFQLIPKQ